MSDSIFLSVAILVFVMMAIGLILTILEFRYGQPKREDKLGKDNSEVKSHAEVRARANERAA
jgi:hypothetical protein